MKLQPEQVKKIAIFRVLQLGDTLCAVPAVRALRAAFPEAHITLLSMPWAKSFTERFSRYFDAFMHFPGYPALPEQPFDARKTVDFLKEAQQQGFDLVLQMQGNGTIVNPLMELFGARYTGGFYSDYKSNDDYFFEYPDYGHEIERHLALMEYLGIPSQGKHLEFPLFDKDFADLTALHLPIEKQQYVCIHPGSRGSDRQWPPRYFAALADYAIEQGLDAVLTGTKEEAPIIEQVINHMKYRDKAINTSGMTSIGSVAALINNAYGLISNCTGVSHIAAALKVPSVVISMDGEPERWGPLNRTLHHTIDWTARPDYDLVFNAAARMLAKRPVAV